MYVHVLVHNIICMSPWYTKYIYIYMYTYGKKSNANALSDKALYTHVHVCSVVNKTNYINTSQYPLDSIFFFGSQYYVLSI